jgi:hypothetical protein
VRRQHPRRYQDEFVFRRNRRRHTRTAFDAPPGVAVRLSRALIRETGQSHPGGTRMTEQPAALPARSVRRALLQAFNTENTKNHGVARSLAARSRVPRHGIHSLNDTQAVGCNVPRRESRSVLLRGAMEIAYFLSA